MKVQSTTLVKVAIQLNAVFIWQNEFGKFASQNQINYCEIFIAIVVQKEVSQSLEVRATLLK